MQNTLVNNLFSKSIEQKATRDGFGDGLVIAGKNNSNVVVFSADLTESTRCEKFKNKFSKRFLEVGVAEQNMVGLAAGLALEGFVPFCSSYAVFNPGRNWEQIRVSVCYNKANVKIAGHHAGLTVGADGATHQALEDIALMRVLPNMIVLSPCDYEEAKKATIVAAKYKGPIYIRLARAKSPIFTTSKTNFKIGKAEIFKPGEDVTIIATGPLVYESLLAARELFKKKISAEVINCSSIKPLDKQTILKSVKKTRRVVTVEDHQVIGGLGSAIAELLSQYYPLPIRIVGVEDMFGESGQPRELLDKYGLNKENIIQNVLELI